jgi:uncharacterized protein YceH (UPF0502 family)
MSIRPLSPVEARVLATLMEKARTVPDSYPLTLNMVVTGCNQKTARDPIMQIDDEQAQLALDALKGLSLVFETSGGRVTHFEHNFQRVFHVPEQSAVVLGLLMLRGPQTAGELRINTERWYKFADISSVEGFLEELQDRSEEKGGPLVVKLPAPPVPASSAGPTWCAGRSTWHWPRRRTRPICPAWVNCRTCRVAWTAWNTRLPSCVRPSKDFAPSWVCRRVDSPERTTVLKT